MDKNSLIGLVLMVILFFIWMQINKPTQEEIARQKAVQDSLARLEQLDESNQKAPSTVSPAPIDTTVAMDTTSMLVDSLVKQKQLNSQFGAFAPAATGSEGVYVLENEVMKLTFSTKGGWVKEAELKNYEVIRDNEERKEEKFPLKFMNDERNRFEYLFPLGSLTISSAELYYQAIPQGDNAVAFRASTTVGGYVEHYYELNPDSYELHYDFRHEGIASLMGNPDFVELHWKNYLNKLEKNTQYERMYSTVYFKPATNGVDYCSCRSDDTEDVDKNLKWFSHSNQFFNTTFIADGAFGEGVLETTMLDESAEALKKLETRVKVPMEEASFGMTVYIGPNEFKQLAVYDQSLEDIIPFGWSIFGTVNRWVVRPIFNFLSSFIGGAGLIILALTVIVKLLVYPLTYRMLYSQSKMAALKPQLAKIKGKHQEDQQKQQMETMKIYREFGVNPLGGCFPLVLQMPIWIALYRFFPASIEFRQASFLWATDLSSYDEFIKLSFEIPFLGDHISMFTLIWVVTTLAYTYYNSQFMDMSSNPMAKYMQYLMPVFFLFFFNNFASGLTAYLCFSNLFNIGQTLVTKKLIINQDKIREELEAYRKKPKKKKGFAQRLEQAMKEQQRIQEEKDKKNKKK